MTMTTTVHTLYMTSTSTGIIIYNTHTLPLWWEDTLDWLDYCWSLGVVFWAIVFVVAKSSVFTWLIIHNDYSEDKACIVLDPVSDVANIFWEHIFSPIHINSMNANYFVPCTHHGWSGWYQRSVGLGRAYSRGCSMSALFIFIFRTAINSPIYPFVVPLNW